MNIKAWDECLVILILGLAVIANIACHNDRSIKESTVQTASRRLIIVAQAVVILRLSWLLFEMGNSPMTQTFLVALVLWGLGSIMSSIDAIGRRWGREVDQLLKPKTYYERRKHPRKKGSHHDEHPARMPPHHEDHPGDSTLRIVAAEHCSRSLRDQHG